jgi:hypothetical protein
MKESDLGTMGSTIVTRKEDRKKPMLLLGMTQTQGIVGDGEEEEGWVYPCGLMAQGSGEAVLGWGAKTMKRIADIARQWEANCEAVALSNREQITEGSKSGT